MKRSPRSVNDDWDDWEDSTPKLLITLAIVAMLACQPAVAIGLVLPLIISRFG